MHSKGFKVRFNEVGPLILSYFKSYLRLVWALFALGASLLGVTVLTQVCLAMNLVDGGIRNCSLQSGQPNLVAILTGVFLIGMALVVWYLGRKQEVLIEQEKTQQIANQKKIYDAILISKDDRAIAGRRVIDQIPFSLPTIDAKNLSNLRDLVQELQRYSNHNFGSKYRTDNVLLADKSYQTIFNIGNTRFSTFIAVVSDQGAILIIDRAKNRYTTTDNDQLDVFGSVGYENMSILNKLFNASNYQELKVISYNAIPGIAIEYIEFTATGKYEVAVMIGHLAVVSHTDIEAIRQSTVFESNELVIVDSPNDMDNRALTSKAELALNYIRDNPRIMDAK